MGGEDGSGEHPAKAHTVPHGGVDLERVEDRPTRPAQHDSHGVAPLRPPVEVAREAAMPASDLQPGRGMDCRVRNQIPDDEATDDMDHGVPTTLDGRPVRRIVGGFATDPRIRMGICPVGWKILRPGQRDYPHEPVGRRSDPARSDPGRLPRDRQDLAGLGVDVRVTPRLALREAAGPERRDIDERADPFGNQFRQANAGRGGRLEGGPAVAS